jgi:hypothetical protein
MRDIKDDRGCTYQTPGAKHEHRHHSATLGKPKHITN